MRLPYFNLGNIAFVQFGKLSESLIEFFAYHAWDICSDVIGGMIV